MGKDSKIIWTKDGLKSENQKLAHKLKELDSKYRQIRHIFTQLESDYDGSYSALPLQRYNLLKQMIKRAVSEENMRKAEALVKKDEEKKKSGGLSRLLGKAKSFGKEDVQAGTSSSASADPPAGRMGGLLAACKTFSGKSDGIESAAAAKKDLSQMSKQEVAEDNELKRRQIEEFDDKFLRAFNTLERLKSDYQSSKQRFPLMRYGQMKTMIKDITQDKDLR